MIRRSITSFVLAFVASLISIFFGFYVGWIATAFSGLGGLQLVILAILGWSCFLGGFLGIIASFFCFRHAKVGAILLTITSSTAGVSLVWMFIKLLVSSSSGDSSQLMQPVLLVFFTLLPALMYVIATIKCYTAKPISKKNSKRSKNSNEEDINTLALKQSEHLADNLDKTE